ncbi:MAG: LssY C-terminal domain-containing protein [Lysobacterales bacterium]|jgi:hypothetical protein
MKDHTTRLVPISTFVVVALLLVACASTPEAINPLPEGDFTQRVQTQEGNGITVSAGVPSASETRKLFGRDLYREGIQPVWLKIQNHRDSHVTFLPVGLDPQYFTPLEVANATDQRQDETPSSAVSLIDEFYLSHRMALVVPGGDTHTGYIFTKLDEGTKAFNVDIAGKSPEDFITFTFFVPVPGLDIDHYSVDWKNLYSPEQYREMSDAELIDAIEKYACCVTDKDGENTGDPLNLVIIGMPDEVYTAFIRAGWDETESVTRASGWKTVKSFLSGGEYRYSPVSNLYAFGRAQDVAFQKARENIHERNHLRLWMSPVTYMGKPVWIGQISRDIGVRFTTKTITTHKIDPDVDETREYLLEDLAYAQSLRAFGYAGGVGEVASDEPRGNLTGDPWYTDGYRLVLWVSSKPLPLSGVVRLPWRDPYDSD